jgi:hypothetical protein
MGRRKENERNARVRTRRERVHVQVGCEFELVGLLYIRCPGRLAGTGRVPSVTHVIRPVGLTARETYIICIVSRLWTEQMKKKANDVTFNQSQSTIGQLMNIRPNGHYEG